MTTSAVPALIDALVEAASNAIGEDVAVYDGTGISDDPGDYLMVGVEDPDQDQGYSADVQQAWAGTGVNAARDEEGDISCAALSWNGDADPRAARDAVYAITDALAALLRANPSLGLPNVLWTSYGTSAQLTQRQSEYGAMALLTFRIHFRARL